MAAPDFWSSPEAAKGTVQKLKSLKAVVDPVWAAIGRAEDLRAMIELLSEAEDSEARAELEEGLDELSKEVNHVELMPAKQ